jgi:hypothetical protein
MSRTEKQQYQDTEAPQVLFDNIVYTIKDGHLLLDIDLHKRSAVTTTGKSINIAGPLGWGIEIPSTDLKLALQLWAPNPNRKEQS